MNAMVKANIKFSCNSEKCPPSIKNASWLTVARQLRNLSGVIALGILLLSAAPSQADGEIRYVDFAYGSDAGNTCTSATSPCRTIQRAVDVAQWRDVILVTGGLYYENIVIDSRKPQVSIQGGWGMPGQGFVRRNVDLYPTEILGRNIGPVFTLEAASISINLAIDGCWLSQGYADRGGAIFARAMNDPRASPMASNGIITLVLSNNRIEKNTALFDGGAIYALAEEPLYGLSDNAVKLTLIDNVIVDNKSLDGAGGALRVEAYGSSIGELTLRRNQIIHNQARSAGGVSILKYGEYAMKVKMENNIIADNVAMIGDGGGMHVLYDVDLYSVNDTITNNAAGRWGSGGGVALSNNGNTEFVNAIIWGNRGYAPDTIFSDIYTTCAVKITYSDIGLVAKGWGGAVVDGTGNLSVDPGFVSPETGNYHLRTDSPVKNAGICGNFFRYFQTRIAPLEDFEGDPRPDPGELQCELARFDSRMGRYICFKGVYRGCSMGADEKVLKKIIKFVPGSEISFSKP